MNTNIRCASTAVMITPPLGTSLAGYFTDRKAEGVYDDLYASILMIAQGELRFIWIACDLCAVPTSFSLPIREAIAKQLGIPVQAVVMSATHTHTGPVMSGPLANTGYVSTTSTQIVKATVQLADHLVPSVLEYGAGVEPRFAFNRRYLMKDGSVMTNPGANNPAVISPAGKVDHSLQVLKVLDAYQHLIALVVNCANHPDTIRGNFVSGDWPGNLRNTVQEKLGQALPVLVLNGTAGDVNHFDVMNHRVVQNLDEAYRIGTGYAETVLTILERTKPLQEDVINVAAKSVAVPYRHINAAELADAQQIVDELVDDPGAVLEGELESQHIVSGHKAVRLMFAQTILDGATNYQDKTQLLEIYGVRLGNLVLIGFNGEVFSEMGLSIKEDSHFEHTMIATLVNGSIGYLGTKKAYQQGGYETLFGVRVCDDVEDYVFSGIAKLKEQLLEAQ